MYNNTLITVIITIFFCDRAGRPLLYCKPKPLVIIIIIKIIIIKIAMLVNKCLRGLAPPYLAELCQPVFELAGRWHLRSAASGKLSVQRTATIIGRRNFAISGPDI